MSTLGLFAFWAGFKEQSLVSAFNIQVGNTDYLMSVVFKAVPIEAFPIVEKVEPLALQYYPIFLIAVVILALLNIVRTKYFGRVKITYPDGKIVNATKGTSVLEAIRSASLPTNLYVEAAVAVRLVGLKWFHMRGNYPKRAFMKQER